ncbi:zinc finger protein 608-like isoform X2 [Ruditapes philippinarum]|nr:zinc finger protein 608-like isoform X2 [Ruditapes philippinarum]
MEPKLGETATGKKECIPDPYEFNAKVEDGISMPMKKMKIEKEKVESSGNLATSAAPSSSTSQGSQDAATDTRDVAIVTDPDCLGPCEPGTQVTLEGIVWHESENGVLVVNVTWRGKTYVGTLLDATRHDWAPPRFNCDSPTIEFESRTPKGRGKRRGAANTPVQDTRTLRKGRRGSNVQTFTAPPSPAKSDISVGGVKRKGRPQDIDLSAAEQRCSKRSRSGSQAPTPNIETPPADTQGYLECPEANCNKKYKNANGLRYHQSHAHSGFNSSNSVDDIKEEMDTEDIPLSVVKNSVRKEKEAKKENNASKKETNKENGQVSDKTKSDKVENAVKKGEKEESNVDNKDTGNKSDSKCDNSNNNSKKKENNSNNKVPVTQSNGKTSGPQSSISKSNSSSNITANVTVSSQVTSNSVQAIPSQTSALSPTASTMTTSVVQSVSQGEKNDSKLVDIKPKIAPDTRVTKANRPIVPAPSHTVLSNVQVTHSNMSPVMSHTQVSPQLKPIQPKPTIMGEPQNINPVLADLNKDRKKLQKKKNKEGSGNGNSQSKPEQPTIKIERTGVIKTNPMPNNRQQSDQGKREGGGHKDHSRPGMGDIPRSHSLTPHQHKGVDLTHSRGGQNPNLLKVGSPLQVNTPDNHKGALNDDVQSPAYSDISDANESASPAAPSDTSPQKHKEDSSNANKKEEKREATPPQQTEGQMVPPYGMYSYYAHSPYRMNEMSPGQKSTGSNSGTPAQGSQANQDMNKNPQNTEKKIPENQPKVEKKPEEKEGNGPRPKGPMPPMSGPPPNNLSSQQYHEYQMHQMYLFQSLPQHVQYQYMVNGMYPMDSGNYMRQMMEDPQRRAQGGDPCRPDREGGPGPDRDFNRGPDAKGSSNVGPMLSKKDDNSLQKSMISPVQNQNAERNENIKSEEKVSGMKSDQSFRDKQNETHQILKENIDLKNEMDKNRHDYERFKKQQDEERRRHQMYQEQKMIEERKKMELARKSAGRPENLTSKAPGTKPIIEHNPRSMSSGLRASVELQSANMRDRDNSVKRDSNGNESKLREVRDTHVRDLSANKYSDSGKSVDEKSRTPIPDKHRSETPTRNPETPKQRPGGSSSKSGSPMTSSSSSLPGSPSYNQYVNTYPYMQHPNYIGMDPSHPMYRNHSVNPALVSAYPGNSYIHPSQMGYRPPGDDEKEKVSAQKSGPVSSESDLKKGDSGHGPYYSNVHKIHELSEKGQPKSRNSSPGPVKPTDISTSTYDKHRDFTNSPPPQRHVHTHHHTHVLQPGPGLPVQAGPPLQGPPGFSPVYDTYSALFASQAQSPHPFPPK